jgi:hypothetical protein
LRLASHAVAVHQSTPSEPQRTRWRACQTCTHPSCQCHTSTLNNALSLCRLGVVFTCLLPAFYSCYGGWAAPVAEQQASAALAYQPACVLRVPTNRRLRFSMGPRCLRKKAAMRLLRSCNLHRCSCVVLRCQWRPHIGRRASAARHHAVGAAAAAREGGDRSTGVLAVAAWRCWRWSEQQPWERRRPYTRASHSCRKSSTCLRRPAW